MSVFKGSLQRRVALCVCICFGFMQFPEVNAAMPTLELAVKAETPRLMNIDIPPELASVEEWFEAPLKTHPKLIVHIQDAHANYEAQTHIRDVIRYLHQNYGFKTILVEGAAEELDSKYLKLFPDEAQNLKLMDELAKEGQVTGAEMILMESGKNIQAIGIEKAKLYQKNLSALQSVYLEDDFTKNFLGAYEKKLGQIASHTLSQSMIQALAEWQKFEAGHRDFLPFANQISKMAKEALKIDLNVLYSQIEWPQLTRLLMLQHLEKELAQKAGDATLREQAIKEKWKLVDWLRSKQISPGLIQAVELFSDKNINLNRLGSSEARLANAPRALMESLIEKGGEAGLDLKEYPAFLKYAGYLIIRSEIVPGTLFDEIRKLFDQILDEWVKEGSFADQSKKNDVEFRRQLLQLYRDEILLKKMLQLELNRKEWLQILSRKNRFQIKDFDRRMRDISGKRTFIEKGSVGMEPHIQRLEQALTNAFRFYEAATNREDYFFQKIQNTLEGNDKAILITGGFHAEGMKSLMRQYNINYGTLTPRISQEPSNQIYRKVMMMGSAMSAMSMSNFDEEEKSEEEGEAVIPDVQKQSLMAALLSVPDSGLLEGVGRAEARRSEVRRIAAERIGISNPASEQGQIEVKPSKAPILSLKPSQFKVRLPRVFNNPSQVLGIAALVGVGLIIAGFISAAFLPAGLVGILLVSIAGAEVSLRWLKQAIYYFSNGSRIQSDSFMPWKILLGNQPRNLSVPAAMPVRSEARRPVEKLLAELSAIGADTARFDLFFEPTNEVLRDPKKFRASAQDLFDLRYTRARAVLRYTNRDTQEELGKFKDSLKLIEMAVADLRQVKDEWQKFKLLPIEQRPSVSRIRNHENLRFESELREGFNRALTVEFDLLLKQIGQVPLEQVDQILRVSTRELGVGSRRENAEKLNLLDADQFQYGVYGGGGTAARIALVNDRVGLLEERIKILLAAGQRDPNFPNLQTWLQIAIEDVRDIGGAVNQSELMTRILAVRGKAGVSRKPTATASSVRRIRSLPTSQVREVPGISATVAGNLKRSEFRNVSVNWIQKSMKPAMVVILIAFGFWGNTASAAEMSALVTETSRDASSSLPAELASLQIEGIISDQPGHLIRVMPAGEWRPELSDIIQNLISWNKGMKLDLFLVGAENSSVIDWQTSLGELAKRIRVHFVPNLQKAVQGARILDDRDPRTSALMQIDSSLADQVFDLTNISIVVQEIPTESDLQLPAYVVAIRQAKAIAGLPASSRMDVTVEEGIQVKKRGVWWIDPDSLKGVIAGIHQAYQVLIHIMKSA